MKLAWAVLLCFCGQSLATTYIGNGTIGVNYAYSLKTEDSLIIRYELSKLDANHPSRVHISTVNGSVDYPIFVILRQGRDVVNWDMPYWSSSGQKYNFVARTVCPFMTDSLFVIVTSPNEPPVDVNVRVTLQKSYLLTADTTVDTSATPSQPRYFRFEFPANTTVVFVEAKSPNDSCAMLFLFKSCSAHDLIEHAFSDESYRQTITKKGGMMVHRKYYPKGHFYVGFVVFANDDNCLDDGTYTPINATPISVPVRIKNISLTIHDISDVETIASVVKDIGFIYAVIFGLVMILALYHFGMKLVKHCRKRNLRHIPGMVPVLPPVLQPLLPDINADGGNQDNNSDAEEEDSDELHSNESINNARHEMIIKFTRGEKIMVSDLCWHDLKQLKEATQLFAWILIAVMIYNGLPVIYMMLVYQLNIHKTGDMDWCYYNFYCAHPWMFFSDFNHIVSNVGYGILGVTFNAIVYWEERKSRELNLDTGIPSQYGLYYAMGWSLFAEGVSSACYHICPNNFNFQIDTCFMFVICVVCLLALYQKRHPSITLHPKKAFIFLAILCSIGWVGELLDEYLWWRFLFSFLHMTATYLCAFHMYYFGQGSILSPQYSFRHIEWLKPKYRVRFILISLFVIVNFALSVVGLAQQPDSFAFYILTILITNLGMGTVHYFISKCCHGEGCIRLLPLFLFLLSAGFGITAFYFFQIKTTEWEVNPATSRTYNQPCNVLGFFDSHDIWHTLSSFALFFYFLVLLNIDKHLQDVPRDQIQVLL
ncbi:SID1 transmembrane family member 1-like [Cloeon dipterum]|uniref:SID1 transmembrane family member 1-like n=1 Tax=Cloeon dipterum TaxID=197152 RepID=UPI00322051EE